MILDFFKKAKVPDPEPDPELTATVVSHPNGLIVVQLSQPLQCVFLSPEEATAIAKALLLEARRVNTRRTANGPDP